MLKESLENSELSDKDFKLCFVTHLHTSNSDMKHVPSSYLIFLRFLFCTSLSDFACITQGQLQEWRLYVPFDTRNFLAVAVFLKAKFSSAMKANKGLLGQGDSKYCISFALYRVRR